MGKVGLTTRRGSVRQLGAHRRRNKVADQLDLRLPFQTIDLRAGSPEVPRPTAGAPPRRTATRTELAPVTLRLISPPTLKVGWGIGRFASKGAPSTLPGRRRRHLPHPLAPWHPPNHGWPYCDAGRRRFYQWTVSTTLPGAVVLSRYSMAAVTSASGKVRFTNTLSLPASTNSATFASTSPRG